MSLATKIEIDPMAPFSDRQVEDLAKALKKLKEIQEAHLFPVFSGQQHVLCVVMGEEGQCELFNQLSTYDKKRDPPLTSAFTSERMRVYVFTGLVQALTEWYRRLSNSNAGPSFLHDVLVLPPNWRQEAARLEQLYYSSCSPKFISALAARRPDVSIIF